MPPNGAFRVDCAPLAAFREYAEQNAYEWYQFINGTLRREAENGSLYLVTGFDKTNAWETALFHSSLSSQSCSLIFTAAGASDGRMRLSQSSVLQTSVTSRCSPSNAKNNQTLFIRGFRISLRQGPSAWILGGVRTTSTQSSSKDIFDAMGRSGSYPGSSPAGSGRGGTSSRTSSRSSGQSPGPDEGDSWTGGSSKDHTSNTSLEEDDFGVPPSQPYHPLNVINDFILQNNPTAEVVVTHDDDWISLLTEKDINMPDDQTLIERFQGTYQVSIVDGYAVLDADWDTRNIDPGSTIHTALEIQPEPISEIQLEPILEIQPELISEIQLEPILEVQPEPFSQVQPNIVPTRQHRRFDTTLSIMASYLQAIFRIGSSRSDRSKTHTRSHSVPTAQQAGRQVAPAYVCTTPTTTVTPTQVQTHPSINPARPSPLRYNTYDVSTVKNDKSHSRSDSSGSCPPRYKSDNKFPYPIYTPAASLSSHSSSNTSSYASSSVSSQFHQRSSHSSFNTSIYAPSSVSSQSCVRLNQSHTWHAGQKSDSPRPHVSSVSSQSPTRPEQTYTWDASQNSDGPRPHVSFINPKRPQTLHMHPLLAASRRARAPISYDVMFAPSSTTIMDRTTRTSVPSHTLQQPATDPPTPGRLVLRSDKFPWSIIVQAGVSSASASQTPKSAAKFRLGVTPALKGSVSNLDLIHALHSTLHTPVTKEEWDALGAGSRAQRKVTKAYESRCHAAGTGWDQGVKRIDWLGGKTRLIGVEVDKTASDTGVAKLVFGKP
ncbi:hypothetical protein WG66_009060 [Moniliophthora roreri]|nr:hypothetical protein WG66_009060 [Moniliophthora roreri]